MRTDGEPGPRPKPADDEIDRGAGEASAFAGAVEVHEERQLLFRAAGLKQGSSAVFVGAGNVITPKPSCLRQFVNRTVCYCWNTQRPSGTVRCAFNSGCASAGQLP